jgi:hypothetical protein
MHKVVRRLLTPLAKERSVMADIINELASRWFSIKLTPSRRGLE